MMMKNAYGKLASLVYEADKPIGTSFGDVAYYLDRLQHTQGPILEPAVGNGRFLIPLLEAGKHVFGYDASAQMLSLARAALQARQLHATLTQDDFLSFEAETCFDAIVIPAGSFQLLDSFALADKVLRRFYAQLNPGGRLLLDIDAAHLITGAQPSVRQWQLDAQSSITLTSQQFSMDSIQQTVTELHRYELWQSGQLCNTEMETFCLRYWGVDELMMALERVGFEHIVVSGNYQFGQKPVHGDAVMSLEASKQG